MFFLLIVVLPYKFFLSRIKRKKASIFIDTRFLCYELNQLVLSDSGKTPRINAAILHFTMKEGVMLWWVTDEELRLPCWHWKRFNGCWNGVYIRLMGPVFKETVVWITSMFRSDLIPRWLHGKWRTGCFFSRNNKSEVSFLWEVQRGEKLYRFMMTRIMRLIIKNWIFMYLVL